jgi:hypothetical protein
MKLRDLIQAIGKSEEWGHHEDGAAFQLTVPQAGGRTQRVSATEFLEEGDPHVRFMSVVGPSSKLDAGRIRAALEINARLPQGCLAIDGENLVLTETRPLTTTTPATSAAAIRYIARQADTYERLIYRTDVQ